MKHKGKHVRHLIAAINPVIRGKANYMKKVVSSKIFSQLDHYLFIRQVRYVKHTHPKQKKEWTRNKYWGKLNLQRNNKWVFGDKRTGAYMLQFNWFSIDRHTLISQRFSPDDPNLKEYWEKRNKKVRVTEAEKLNQIQQKVAKKQDYKCPVCGESIFNDEPLHLHHIIPWCKGGKDVVKNLVWLHQFCHHKVHHQKE